MNICLFTSNTCKAPLPVRHTRYIHGRSHRERSPRQYWLFTPEFQWQSRGKQPIQAGWSRLQNAAPVGMVEGADHSTVVPTRAHSQQIPLLGECTAARAQQFIHGQTAPVAVLGRLLAAHLLDRSRARGETQRGAVIYAGESTPLRSAVYPWIATETQG
jgi:hypothetical protein